MTANVPTAMLQSEGNEPKATSASTPNECWRRFRDGRCIRDEDDEIK